MGTHCSHNRLEPTGLTNQYSETGIQGIVFEYEAGEIECKDCGQKFRGIRHKGKLTGISYTGWKIIDPETCSHETYKVDESTKKIGTEHALVGCVVRLFTGPSLDGIQYRHFWMADAKCKKCDKVIQVRCEYGKKWQDKQIVEYATTDWIQINKTQ